MSEEKILENLTRPTVVLCGEDGNAFAIMGKCRKAARKAGWTDEQWKAVHAKMMEGDYDHLLMTAMEYFDVD